MFDWAWTIENQELIFSLIGQHIILVLSPLFLL